MTLIAVLWVDWVDEGDLVRHGTDCCLLKAKGGGRSTGTLVSLDIGVATSTEVDVGKEALFVTVSTCWFP